MTVNRPTGRQKAPGKNVPPTSRRSARQQRLANREANRALTKASTHGSSGGSQKLLIGSTIAIVAVMAIIAGVWLVTRPPAFSEAPIAPGILTPSNIPSNSTTLGQASAPVTMDLYGDFRCIFCFDFTSVQEPQLVQNYVSTGKAKLVWHDLIVIDSAGVTESRDAANAARCAADEGKFWLLHDWLYANQSADESPGAFTQERLLTIGKDAGLDTAKYDPCVQQGTHLSEVQKEQTNQPAGIGGTPAIFVNGKQIQGPVDSSSGQATVPTYDLIAAAIDGVLNPSASPAASGSVSPSASTAPSTVPSATPSTAPSTAPSASPS